MMLTPTGSNLLSTDRVLGTVLHSLYEPPGGFQNVVPGPTALLPENYYKCASLGPNWHQVS